MTECGACIYSISVVGSSRSNIGANQVGGKANTSSIAICALFVISLVLGNIIQSCSDKQKADSEAVERQASSERIQRSQEYAERERMNNRNIQRCSYGSFC
jgi:hypothetical protein